LVEQGAGGVGNLTHSALVVGEHPAGLASRLFGEDLVYRGAMEVAFLMFYFHTILNLMVALCHVEID
jgi:hypothetical protein